MVYKKLTLEMLDEVLDTLSKKNTKQNEFVVYPDTNQYREFEDNIHNEAKKLYDDHVNNSLHIATPVAI